MLHNGRDVEYPIELRRRFNNPSTADSEGWLTRCNLERFLNTTFGLSLADIYGTNVFPFIKSGGVSRRIPARDLIKAALEFALPQIEIVKPRLVSVWAL